MRLFACFFYSYTNFKSDFKLIYKRRAAFLYPSLLILDLSGVRSRTKRENTSVFLCLSGEYDIESFVVKETLISGMKREGIIRIDLR